MSIFEVLREEVDVVAVSDRHLDLARSGNAMKGRCPYPDHADENPSFYVYPDGRFFCHGCRRHGDVVDLWALVKRIKPGIEAALDLAREYEITLPDIDSDLRRQAEATRNAEEVYAARAGEAHGRLSEHPDVLQWWERRGFDGELRERFLLGASEDGAEAIIPFWYRGRVHGLIRRKLQGEPKYVLPKAEEFPHGRRPLFFMGATRGEVALVEGYVDALALAALGIDAIAIGGTGISEHQREGLRVLPGPIYIMPDNDKEGEKAARRWVEDLYPKALLCPPAYEEVTND